MLINVRLLDSDACNRLNDILALPGGNGLRSPLPQQLVGARGSGNRGRSSHPPPHPTLPADDSTQPATTPKPAPVAINPKTGLPYTAEELRQQEIDKYDPLKRDQDTATPAQDSTPLTDRKQPDTVADPAAKTPPVPGSIAASNQAAAASGSKKAQGSAQASTQDSGSPEEGDSGYSGPAVLTRSYTLARPMDATSIKWTGSLGFTYSWDDGDAPGLVNGATGFVSAKASAVALNWTLTGRHRWKRDLIGLSYTGNYSQYFARNTLYNLSGLNNSLNLDYFPCLFAAIPVSPRREPAGSFAELSPWRTPRLQPGSSVANISLATSPTIQLLNTTVQSQSSTQAGVTYRQNSPPFL